MMIHEIDEEDENDLDEMDQSDDQSEREHESESTIAPPPPRSRKARESQKLLGLGIPVIAAGSDPSVMSKMDRFKRGKGTGTIKSDAIMEDGVSTAIRLINFVLIAVIQLERHPSLANLRRQPAPPGKRASRLGTGDSLISLVQVDKCVAEAVRLFHARIVSSSDTSVRLASSVA
jgi:hypothetical protein